MLLNAKKDNNPWFSVVFISLSYIIGSILKNMCNNSMIDFDIKICTAE